MTKRHCKPWENLSNGKRSAISLLWNKYLDLNQVAKRTETDVEIVMAYLSSRPGYPDRVVRVHDRKSKPRPTKMEMGIPPNLPQQKPVTLPRVRILEKPLEYYTG